MIELRAGTRIWLAAGITDMRCGFHGLSAKVQMVLNEQPYSGHVFVFRGRRGDLIKILWFDGDGLCLFAKRLERGRFIWPQAAEGAVSLSRAQLSMLLEGIDWRRPARTWTPQLGRISNKCDSYFLILKNDHFSTSVHAILRAWIQHRCPISIRWIPQRYRHWWWPAGWRLLPRMRSWTSYGTPAATRSHI